MWFTITIDLALFLSITQNLSLSCSRHSQLPYPMGLFKSFVMNNKGFRKLFCNLQKSFHSSPTLIIEAVNHSSNSTVAFTKNFTSSRIFFFFFGKYYCWVWRMVDSLYYSRRKIPERCENSFVNYRINYQKLCYLIRQITKDLNSATDDWIIDINHGEQILDKQAAHRITKRVNSFHTCLVSQDTGLSNLVLQTRPQRTLLDPVLWLVC